MKKLMVYAVLLSLAISLFSKTVSAAPFLDLNVTYRGSFPMTAYFPIRALQQIWASSESRILQNTISENGSDAAETAKSSNVEQFIAIAESKLASRYERGGKGPNAFDCSGFVYWCLNQAGVNQPYWTSAMWRNGNYVKIASMDELKRGDILVFEGHVGIYLGDGSMISALNRAKGICISKDILHSPYRIKRFLCAYRVF